MRIKQEEYELLKRRLDTIDRECRYLQTMMLLCGLITRNPPDYEYRHTINIECLKKDFERLLEHFDLEFVDVPEKRELRIKET